MNLGPYTLVGEIGHGGMGVVLKAIDSRDGRSVAIKLISGKGVKDERARIGLVREAGATSSLRHRNIVSIYDVNQYRGNLYIVMEFLEGASLERLILRRWPLKLQQRLQIIVQLCGALAHAHERGVVHRDIKPANIFILRDGTVKVLDFGLAAVAQISGSNLTGWVGTIPYMSPEQVNRSDIDGRSDIWSAGITLFQLLAGNQPFTGDSVQSTFMQILNSPVPELSQSIPIANELNSILQHALHKERNKRYASAHLFGAELRRLIPAAQSRPWIPLPANIKITDGLTQVTLDTFSLMAERGQLSNSACEIQPRVTEDGLDSQNITQDVYKSLNLGFTRETSGSVVITSGRFSLIAVRRWMLRREMFSGLVAFGLIATLILMLSSILYPSLVIMEGATIAFVGLIVLLVIPVTWLLESYPRCKKCRLPMWRKSTWTRYVKSNAEVVFGYRDCEAALRSSFWEDAAKLLCIHGAERTSLYASRTVDTPLRYNLEFYECETCIQRVARLTTDELIQEKWFTRPGFVQARQGPAKQEAHVFHILASTPNRVFFIFADLLRKIISKIRFNSKVAAFCLASCLILILSGYYSGRRLNRRARDMTGTAGLVAVADEAYFGFGGSRNLPLAAEYYKKAAEKGDVDSANRLAEMLEHGLGLSVDMKESLRWYQLSANHGNARAQYNVGRFYENGLGVPIDQKEAMRWYREAAKQGNGDADYSLGRFYEDGIAVPKDPEQAMSWYRAATRLGNPDARNRMLALQLQLQGSNKVR
jgi:serine/threonine protein kinase